MKKEELGNAAVHKTMCDNFEIQLCLERLEKSEAAKPSPRHATSI